ncbi:MAG: glycosyltransferase [Verrucomicrobiae bacterium]|nr:glycosyltransferase [Verrucomicrobiae bacterium]
MRPSRGGVFASLPFGSLTPASRFTPPPLRLCDVTQFYSPVSGGVKRYLTEKRDYLARHTADEHVLLVPGPRHAARTEGRCTQIEIASPRVSFSSHYRFVWNVRRVETLIREAKPDLIEAGEPYQLAWACLRAGRALGVPVVGFYHSHFPESYFRTFRRFGGRPAGALVDGLSRRYIRRLYNRFDLTLVASPKLERVLQGYGVGNTRLVPLGVETDVFEPSARDPLLRRRLGVQERQALLLFVGRLSREKRMDLLLEAFSIIRRYAGDRFALLVVGEGAERARVEEARGANPDLHWLPYEGDARKLASIYASADLLVHPSPCETFGLVALEAQACGIPALAFRGSGMDDLIFGGPEFLAPEMTAESLARAVLRVAQGDLREIGAHAREAVIRRYPWKTVFKALFEIYAGCVKR